MQQSRAEQSIEMVVVVVVVVEQEGRRCCNCFLVGFALRCWSSKNDY